MAKFHQVRHHQWLPMMDEESCDWASVVKDRQEMAWLRSGQGQCEMMKGTPLPLVLPCMDSTVRLLALA